MSGVRVTPDNFARAESDLYFGNIVKDGGFGRYFHVRELTPIDHQLVIRSNRDTLYSAAIFDLDAGPVTVTLPDAGGRFLSMQVIDEDHYTSEVVYGAGEHTLAREQIGTRYVATVVRILINPDDPDDLPAVHALQDSIAVRQDDSGSFDVPQWDPVSQRTVRDALVTLATTLTDTRRAFGTRTDTDPVRHLIGTANAWGGNPEEDALYLTVIPPANDGTTVHRMVVGDVPVDGFWSVTMYDAEGFQTPNVLDRFAIGDRDALTFNADGSLDLYLTHEAPAGHESNWLPAPRGPLGVTLRLYAPRAPILDGTWTAPPVRRLDR